MAAFALNRVFICLITVSYSVYIDTLVIKSVIKFLFEPRHEISDRDNATVCGMCDQRRLRPACAYAQSDQSLC